jgi:hypothetical protein
MENGIVVRGGISPTMIATSPPGGCGMAVGSPDTSAINMVLWAGLNRRRCVQSRKSRFAGNAIARATRRRGVFVLCNTAGLILQRRE